MKKNILFIIPSLGAGGGQKSLVNLLNIIDYSKYNVDIFLLNHEGLFMKFIPCNVNILCKPDNLTIFSMKLYKAIFKFLCSGKIKLFYSRVMFSIINRIIRNKAKAEQYSWKYLRQAVGKINKKYDIAIGYLEKTSNYLCVDSVIADKKLGWIHNDYTKLEVDKKMDMKYFKKLDYIITVSKKCECILKVSFPIYSHKIKLIHNVVSQKMIETCANNESDDFYDKSYVNILSIGRLHSQKGFDMAVDACRLLNEDGYKIRWNIIGDGLLKDDLKSRIKKNGIEKNFKLMGLKANPYPYIKYCDIYVQPSRYEGKSIAIDEAKILCKPIIITNFSTAKDQIRDGEDGLIVEMAPKSISEGIKKIIIDSQFKNTIIENLKKEKLGTENEIYKLCKLFD